MAPALRWTVLLAAAGCRVAVAAALGQRSAAAASEELLKACTGALERFSGQLSECEALLQKVEESCPGCGKGPVCNCHCPTCMPKAWEELDMASLPPCTTPPPEEAAEAAAWAANARFQYAVPECKDCQDLILSKPTAPPVLPFEKLPGLPVIPDDRYRSLVSPPGLALADARGDSSLGVRVRSQQALKKCKQSALEVEAKFRSCDEQRRHAQRSLRFLRSGDPHECQCNCPPCDAGWGPPPTCRPPDEDAEDEKGGGGGGGAGAGDSSPCYQGPKVPKLPAVGKEHLPVLNPYGL